MILLQVLPRSSVYQKMVLYVLHIYSGLLLSFQIRSTEVVSKFFLIYQPADYTKKTLKSS